eukprot:6129017-Amphidinium_carterae.2
MKPEAVAWLFLCKRVCVVRSQQACVLCALNLLGVFLQRCADKTHRTGRQFAVKSCSSDEVHCALFLAVSVSHLAFLKDEALLWFAFTVMAVVSLTPTCVACGSCGK